MNFILIRERQMRYLSFHLKLTLELMKDYLEIEKVFRLICFNVFAHNRDDHSPNFTFLYNEKKKGGYYHRPMI